MNLSKNSVGYVIKDENKNKYLRDVEEVYREIKTPFKPEYNHASPGLCVFDDDEYFIY